jgi:hypothetical protein
MSSIFEALNGGLGFLIIVVVAAKESYKLNRAYVKKHYGEEYL